MVNIESVKQVATRTLGRGLLITKKYSPEILTTVGVIGVVASAVFASRATLNLEPVVDKVRHDLDGIDENDKKLKTQVLVKGAVDLTKLYGPSVSLGLASIACIVSAHGIMRRRNVALVAALNVVEKSFAKYRQRVIDEFGIEKDLAYRMGFDQVEVENEDGTKSMVTTVDLAGGASPYAKFFDEFSSQWKDTPDYNLYFLKNVQNNANDRLRARGHMFLNEIYDVLDIPRTKEGWVVGWIFDKDNEVGDNVIDFGIYDFANEAKVNFIEGLEKSIRLDFNVDGPVLDRIKF